MRFALYFKEAIEKDKDFVTLYHIKNTGGLPKPHPLLRYNEDHKSRDWLSLPLNEINGIFLTTNPYAVAYHHGFSLNTYKVFVIKISQNIIKKSKGIHRYDQATEIIIDNDNWNKGISNKEIFIIGKISESKIEKEMNDYIHSMNSKYYKIDSNLSFKDDDDY